ncbi:myogenesis-regulating glycosidase-like [Saccoglossus kowalevskii]|uniref:Uncharacterized family 31 glucosidase KIAA1161-like n=1 Tax=Saccoglossus kowalevskii TaxID=10224 RepID=A0ABM0MKG7_SACKO|nr:PREDICTED: uncharacterized family 31 glucosidase KIAA1161-like [Saccoglossus kowalevskii]
MSSNVMFREKKTCCGINRILFISCLVAAIVIVAIIIVVAVILAVDNSSERVYNVGGAELIVDDSNEVTIKISSVRGLVLEGTLGINLPNDQEYDRCDDDDDGGTMLCLRWDDVAMLKLTTTETGETTCYDIYWSSSSRDHEPLDCFLLTGAHWYGSAEMYYQLWPIEKWNEPMTVYLSGDMLANPTDYGSVLERYWLSSQGVGIFVEEDVPLFASLNYQNDSKLCYKAKYEESAYPNRDKNPPFMKYSICTNTNIRTAHTYMSSRFFQKPSNIPDERMMRLPIWSTWARYKVNISQEVILDYAQEILENDFPNSQLEIDDGWATLYGDLQFDPVKFPDPTQMCTDLHAMGFRITIWTHPFGNYDSNAFAHGIDMEAPHYWVREPRGDAPGLVRWWNGIAGIIDVFHNNAYDWNVERMEAFCADVGIDSYKFDAGEINYLPVGFVLSEKINNPCEYTKKHAEMSAELGNMVEIRAAWQSHHLPIFVRMMDKGSKWGYDNGLKTVINTALTFGILGYPFVLPDMIGGNAYNEGFHGDYKPEQELFIRWLELTAFLPAMQFSISPWQYDDPQVTEIARYWVKFHNETIGPKLVELAMEVTENGSPIIRPLWWIAPEDEVALTIDSEFLVGDDLLVAPVLEKGMTSRDVYLPEGRWVNELTGEVVDGGQWFNVQVQIQQIAYFTKEENVL